MKKINVIIIGAGGRMGQNNIKMSLNSDGIEIVGAIDVKESPVFGKDIGLLVGSRERGIKVSDDISAIIDKSDLLIDFSTPLSTLKYLKEAVDHKKSYIIGTTGFNQSELDKINDCSKSIAIVLSGNFSTGINLLMGLVKKAASAVNDFDIEIVEQHHKHKIDAPSGTAIMLAKSACESRGLDYEKVVVTGRSGSVGARHKNEIGVFAVRGGGIIGEHKVILAGENERIEISHSAIDRTAFTGGVIKAAKWVVRQSPALYDMQNVLGFNEN